MKSHSIPLWFYLHKHEKIKIFKNQNHLSTYNSKSGHTCGRVIFILNNPNFASCACTAVTCRLTVDGASASTTATTGCSSVSTVAADGETSRTTTAARTRSSAKTVYSR